MELPDSYNGILRVLGETDEFHTKFVEPITLILFYMNYKAKKELVRKVGLFGLSDVKRLAPIGDLGYANGWYTNGFFPKQGTFMEGGLERMIYDAACEQGYSFQRFMYNERGTDTHYCCKELGIHYHVDSSD